MSVRHRVSTSWMLALPILTALACGGCSSDDGPSNTPNDGGPSNTGPVDAVTETTITVGNMTFNARVAGPETGEAVFLLHGFPQTSFEWRYTLPVLAGAGYRVIAPDQRGYSPGARPTDVASYSAVNLVKDVLDMADELGIQKFHVVGHDWGAGVAWGVAGLAKERVYSVTSASIPHPDAFSTVLADPSSCQYAASGYFDLFVSPQATNFLLEQNFQGYRIVYSGLPEEDIAWYLDELGTRDVTDAALNWYRANIQNRNFITPKLGPVTVPTLFVWSDQDIAICRAGVDLTASYVNAPYRLEVIPGIAHWLVELAPDRFNAALLAHLAAHGAK